MLIAHLPDPNRECGDVTAKVFGLTFDILAINVRQYIAATGYGASDIGSSWKVLDTDKDKIVGEVRYNGSFRVFEEDAA